MKRIDFNSKSIEEKFYGMLLRMQIYGVLNISQSRYLETLEFYVLDYMKDDLLYDDGFYIEYNTKTKSIKKYPIIDKGDKYIEGFFKDNNLYMNKLLSFQAYRDLMKSQINKYNKIYNANKIQKRSNKK